MILIRIVNLISLAAIEIAMVFVTPSIASPESLQGMLNELGKRETGLSIGDPDQYTCENSQGNIGKYQFGEALLYRLGYFHPYGSFYNGPGSGVNKNYWRGTWGKGIKNKQGFMVPLVQETAIREAFILNFNSINEQLRKKTRKTIYYFINPREGITLSGILAGAHLVGDVGVTEFLVANQVRKDENKTDVTTYI